MISSYMNRFPPPLSTYRLQLNQSFTFDDARQVVPYLAALGITHCYSSPCLMARPGSPHGYDICDHTRLNPELGGDEAYDAFVRQLCAHGLGHVLDFVPNHMGIDPRMNPWWRDVLENGPSSVYAHFFDIDWEPVNEALEGKVLLPLLGDQYGAVLERGELRLAFADGSLFVDYVDSRLPINPRDAPQVYRIGLDALRGERGDDHPHVRELLSIITAHQNMPATTETDPARIEERRREKDVARDRLVRLLEQSPRIREHIDQSVARVNGTPGVPESFDLLHELLEAQPYRLSYWRTASHEINYRRFFDINDLAGLRMVDDDVFAATHALVLRLIADGKVVGLRIDHPDGLFDPARYFSKLQAEIDRALAGAAARENERRPLYLVAEKILSGGEELPGDWPVHGTTGYNFLNDVNGLFVAAAQARTLRKLYARFSKEDASFGEVVYESKKLIIETAMASELNVLAHALHRIAQGNRRSRDFTLNSLRDVLVEVVACFPVYRTYVSPAGWALADRATIETAVARARRRNPAMEATIFDFLREVLLPRGDVSTMGGNGAMGAGATGAIGASAIAAPSAPNEPSALSAPAPGAPNEPGAPTAPLMERRGGVYAPRDPDEYQRRLAFTMKLQQYTAPVQAKGLEDTAFYRYNLLLSLNEVGGDPARIGRSPADFHSANRLRRERWPYELLATSTHDAKLGEDVRARLNALSELADDWRRELGRWARINAPHRRMIDNEWAPDRNDEYRFYQILLGAWPPEAIDAPQVPAGFVDRVRDYMIKAIKEAKVHTSWINDFKPYDDAVAAFVVGALMGPTAARFLSAFAPFARRVARLGMVNSLAQLVLKIASPGVPDFYQGTELWDLNLVDPDNRRPVDYGVRSRLLNELLPLIDASIPSGGSKDPPYVREDDASIPPGGSRDPPYVPMGEDVSRESGDRRNEHAPRDANVRPRDGRVRLGAADRAAAVGALLDRWKDGRVKLFVTACGLRLRQRHPELFRAGEYVPLASDMTVPADVVAFARLQGAATIIAAAPRLVAAIAPDEVPLGAAHWRTSRILLAPSVAAPAYRNLLTGEDVRPVSHGTQSWLFAAEVFRTCPVALLMPGSGL